MLSANVIRVSSGHDGCSARRTFGLHVVLLQDDTGLGQVVQVGGLEENVETKIL